MLLLIFVLDFFMVTQGNGSVLEDGHGGSTVGLQARFEDFMSDDGQFVWLSSIMQTHPTHSLSPIESTSIIYFLTYTLSIIIPSPHFRSLPISYMFFWCVMLSWCTIPPLVRFSSSFYHYFHLLLLAQEWMVFGWIPCFWSCFSLRTRQIVCMYLVALLVSDFFYHCYIRHNNNNNNNNNICQENVSEKQRKKQGSTYAFCQWK